MPITARWTDTNSGWRSKHADDMGPGVIPTQNKGRADIQCSCMLCPGNKPRLKSLLQLLQRWQHCGVGFAQSNVGAPVPRSHRWCKLYRHFTRWYQVMDRQVIGCPALVFLCCVDCRPCVSLHDLFYFQVVLTTQWGPGISVKDGSSNSMTSHLRSSPLDIVHLETGWQLGKEVPMNHVL